MIRIEDIGIATCEIEVFLGHTGRGLETNLGKPTFIDKPFRPDTEFLCGLGNILQGTNHSPDIFPAMNKRQHQDVHHHSKTKLSLFLAEPEIDVIGNGHHSAVPEGSKKIRIKGAMRLNCTDKITNHFRNLIESNIINIPTVYFGRRDNPILINFHTVVE